jgi:ribbon-helix-helix CopG family protein
MSHIITVRLPEDLAEWLDSESRKTGVPRGRLVRDQLQLAREREKRPFLRLAGSVEGARNLSTRKGFARA